MLALQAPSLLPLLRMLVLLRTAWRQGVSVGLMRILLLLPRLRFAQVAR